MAGEATSRSLLVRRSCAAIIDRAFVVIPVFVWVTHTTALNEPPWVIAWDLLLTIVYFCAFERRGGPSPGKWLFRVRVTTRDGRPPGLGRTLMRAAIACPVPIIGSDLCLLLIPCWFELRGV